jgi:hypothetical protein
MLEVELDVFSGLPNPKWVLTNAEADNFAMQLARLRRISAQSLSGNVGYRGFIVQMTNGTGTRQICIQTGTVHVSEGAKTVYARDGDHALERWLLNTGRPHLKNELFQIAERELR